VGMWNGWVWRKSVAACEVRQRAPALGTGCGVVRCAVLQLTVKHILSFVL